MGDQSAKLRVVSPPHRDIESTAVAIHDAPTLHEMEVDVICITRPSYDGLSAYDPNFHAQFLPSGTSVNVRFPYIADIRYDTILPQ